MLLRKHIFTLLILISIVAVSIAAIEKDNFTNEEDPVYIEPSEQRSGNAQKGYEYLINGNYIQSGIGYDYYLLINGKNKNNLLQRTGKAAVVNYNFNVIKTGNNVSIVVPNCLQCHAQVFDGKLVIGLGNSLMDFSTVPSLNDAKSTAARKVMQTISPRQYEAAQPLIRSFNEIYPFLQTAVQGVNAADRLASLLAAHRDPETLEWHDKALLDVPDEVVPTDVPAWWLLKKKNAMFYNGFGRGDFATFLMLSNLLTVKDTLEAKETSTHFGDVLAYLKMIEPPKYTHSINAQLASKGKEVFIVTCSKCHGSYGDEAKYPNLLIPENIIGTDSMLFKSNYQNPQFIEWFNKSWYAKGNYPARLAPFNGYAAPPLDGVWITAPYLHNGSVPTLEALLNSKERPRYWQRDFKNPQYDYEKVGLKYDTLDKPVDKKTYNTDMAGYRNTGHNFGDALSAENRKALIEYLKTL
jgi:mono/diheme cytochrome c family protein